MIRLALVAGAIGLFLVGYHWGNRHKRGDSAPPVIAGVLVRPPQELPGFELRAAGGLPFTAESFQGHWTLLSLGDLGLAPGHLAVTHMIEVYNRLAGEPELQEELQLALVAERQDLALARDFSRLSPALRLLSGEPGEVQRLRGSLGATSKDGTDSGDSEQITLYLIGPGGRLLVLFPGGQAPTSVAADLSAIAQQPESLYPAND